MDTSTPYHTGTLEFIFFDGMQYEPCFVSQIVPCIKAGCADCSYPSWKRRPHRRVQGAVLLRNCHDHSVKNYELRCSCAAIHGTLKHKTKCARWCRVARHLNSFANTHTQPHNHTHTHTDTHTHTHKHTHTHTHTRTRFPSLAPSPPPFLFRFPHLPLLFPCLFSLFMFLLRL